MKTNRNLKLIQTLWSRSLIHWKALVLISFSLGGIRTSADETCMSPYMAKITGKEEFVYIWTLGVEGLGDGSDKLVTVDVRDHSATFGKVIHSYSVGGRHEAHHGGFTDDRHHYWLAGLDTSRIFIFDIRSDPAAPRLIKTIDISISADDKTLFVDCFMEGKVRVFNVSNPHRPKQKYEETIGKQVNMVSQSWDGNRLYFTSSLLANWDKKGTDNEQFLKAYKWDGKKLTPRFSIDFNQAQLGRPHIMRFGSSQLYQ